MAYATSLAASSGGMRSKIWSPLRLALPAKRKTTPKPSIIQKARAAPLVWMTAQTSTAAEESATIQYATSAAGISPVVPVVPAGVVATSKADSPQYARATNRTRRKISGTPAILVLRCLIAPPLKRSSPVYAYQSRSVNGIAMLMAYASDLVKTSGADLRGAINTA